MSLIENLRAAMKRVPMPPDFKPTVYVGEAWEEALRDAGWEPKELDEIMTEWTKEDSPFGKVISYKRQK